MEQMDRRDFLKKGLAASMVASVPQELLAQAENIFPDERERNAILYSEFEYITEVHRISSCLVYVGERAKTQVHKFCMIKGADGSFTMRGTDAGTWEYVISKDGAASGELPEEIQKSLFFIRGNDNKNHVVDMGFSIQETCVDVVS